MNTHERDYYTAVDILEIVGCKIDKAYKIIRELNEELRTEYPGTYTIQGRVAKWYFEEKLMNKKRKV